MSNSTASLTSPTFSSSFIPSSTLFSASSSSAIFTGSSIAPSTALVTSILTKSASDAQSSQTAIVVTSTSFFTSSAPTTSSTHSSSTSSATSAVSSSPATLSSSTSTSKSSGLSPAGVTAIAVVIPVVVVALLLLGAIFWWRKRKQKKTAQEARRKEVEEYGYNPNEDPTLPAVAGGGADSPEMSEDTAGYRGWGNNATTSSGRKPSTNLSSGIGMAVSDDGQRASPSSPGNNTTSDGGHSGDPLVDGTVGAAAGAGLAGGAIAHHNSNNQDGVQRGPSNASSSYSNAGRTEASDDGHAGDFGYDQNYTQYAPYRPGATQYEDTSQPVIRDVSARRNTKIENPSVFPKQGNSGISQNF